MGAAVTVGYVAAGVPLLATPVPGAAGVDSPRDAKTVFLLLAKQKEEERVKEEEQRLAQLVAGRPLLEEWVKKYRRKRSGKKLPNFFLGCLPLLALLTPGHLDIILYGPFDSASLFLCLGVAFGSTAATCLCVRS